MKEIRLKFHGYTWEDYAFQISSLRGIFVIYKGKLDLEGAVLLQDILYIGYHQGIYEMYDEGCMDQIKNFVTANGRIFLSYSEVPAGVDGEEVEQFLRRTVKPRFGGEETAGSSEMQIVCGGACALFPKEILSKEL